WDPRVPAAGRRRARPVVRPRRGPRRRGAAGRDRRPAAELAHQPISRACVAWDARAMSDSSATLLQGGRVVSADGEYDADVLIVGEKIAAVGEVEAPPGATVLDVSGCR